MKKIGVMLLLFMFCISMVSACSGQNEPKAQTEFPYKDLSEEAYVQNAKSAMDNQTAYLDTAEGDDRDAVLQTYYDDVRKETTRDSITSSEIIMAYEEHLLEARGESWESIQAMKGDELATFREKKGDIEKQIPNACA